MPAPCAVLRLGPSVEAGLAGQLPGCPEWRQSAGRSGRHVPSHRSRASAAHGDWSGLALPQPSAVPTLARQHGGQRCCALNRTADSSTVEYRLSPPVDPLGALDPALAVGGPGEVGFLKGSPVAPAVPGVGEAEEEDDPSILAQAQTQAPAIGAAPQATISSSLICLRLGLRGLHLFFC